MPFAPLCSRTDWVMQLGPPTFGDDGLYEYSLVSNPIRTRLYVLARDPDDFRLVSARDPGDFRLVSV